MHSPRHVRSVADLDVDELEAVAEAWQKRAAAGRRDALGYLHAFVNEGREAGASLAHSHSQLAWLPDAPAAARTEPGAAGWLEDALAEGSLVVARRDGVALLAAYAGRLAYECVVVPEEDGSESAFGSPLLATALGLLAEAARRLHELAGRVPLNAWLVDGARWRVELVPRTSTLAGLELGAGIFVNTVLPEDAAERLRSVSL